MTKTVRISSKGQLVLPKSLRESKKWQSGTELAVEAVDGGVFLRTLSPFPGTTIEQVFGCLNYRGKPKTLAEMGRLPTGIGNDSVTGSPKLCRKSRADYLQ